MTIFVAPAVDKASASNLFILNFEFNGLSPGTVRRKYKFHNEILVWERIEFDMKALIKDADFESYKLKEIETPVPKEQELLVKILKVSICGSDIALYRWNDGERRRDTISHL